MYTFTLHLGQAVEIEGQICTGDSTLDDLPGFHVDYHDDLEIYDDCDIWALADFDDIVPVPRLPQ